MHVFNRIENTYSRLHITSFLSRAFANFSATLSYSLITVICVTPICDKFAISAFGYIDFVAVGWGFRLR